jgi:hypothetical protein
MQLILQRRVEKLSTAEVGQLLTSRGDGARGYDPRVAEADGTLQEQLEEIRIQLGWVRDYL